MSGQISAGRPWYTVPAQFAFGAARRWLPEMETSGISGNSLKNGGSSGRSSRPCSVVTVFRASARNSGKCTLSMWKWSTSNSCARWRTRSSITESEGRVSFVLGSRRSALGAQATSFARVAESPLAKSVTSWPRRTSSSVR